MPAIRKIAERVPPPAEPIRRSERLRRKTSTPAAVPADTYAPSRAVEAAPTPAIHVLRAPPNPDHVHAAQARFGHLNAAFNEAHALAMVGRISTENARLTHRLPNLRHRMHDLMLQCLPLSHTYLYSPDFGQRRNDLHRLSWEMADAHEVALAVEFRLQACVSLGDGAALGAIDRHFKQLYARVEKIFDDSRVISASLERHLMVIRGSQVQRPPIIAPWHLLPSLEVPAAQLAGEHCPLSMAEPNEILEPVVLPLGKGLQLYSRCELELWLHTSKHTHTDEYLFLNPTSQTWERLSQLRRLIVVEA